MILRNWSSPVLQEEGGPKRAKASSASRVNESQSAFLRLMKVRWGGSGRFIWKELSSWIMIGRWSERRAFHRGIYNHNLLDMVHNYVNIYQRELGNLLRVVFIGNSANLLLLLNFQEKLRNCNFL